MFIIKSIFKPKLIPFALKFHARAIPRKIPPAPKLNKVLIFLIIFFLNIKQKTFEDSKIIEDEIFSEKFTEDSKVSKQNPLEKAVSSTENKEIDSLSKNDDISKNIDKEKMKFIRESLLYSGDDPFPEKLVERPEKGVVWGLGGELLKFKESKKKIINKILNSFLHFIDFFKKGVMPTPEEVIAFLEVYNYFFI